MKRLIMFLIVVVCLTGFLFAQEVVDEPAIQEEVDAEAVETEISVEDSAVQGEVVPEEEVLEEEPLEDVTAPVQKSLLASFKPYVNFGPIEPWGSTGGMFDMGVKAQGGIHFDPNALLSLPVILTPLRAEFLVGFTSFNIKEGGAGSSKDASMSIVSYNFSGRYDISDLVKKYLGVAAPSLGFFGFAGVQVNIQDWDFPEGGTYDSQTAFGLNLGLGVKYDLEPKVGLPLEIDLRFTQLFFVMGDVEDQDGNPLDDPYSHAENGILFGVSYTLPF